MHQFFLPHLSHCICVCMNKFHLFITVIYAKNDKRNLFIVKDLLFLIIIYH